MATPPLIRRACPADAPALADFAGRSFIETFVNGFAIPYSPEDLASFLAQSCSTERLLRLVEDARVGAWVAEADEAIVAYAIAGPASLPHAEVRAYDGELYRLYVDRSWQGCGLGRRMLEVSLKWLDPEGARRLFIGVWSGNIPAQRLYAAHGFSKVGEYDFAVGRTLDREFILRRG